MSQWSIYQYKASNTQWSKTVSKEREHELPLKFSFCQPSIKNNVERYRRLNAVILECFFVDRREVKWESGKGARLVR